MRTRTASLLLVALVVLAGCAGSASQRATTTTETETARTTDGIATDVSTADLPPGVNESGVENASRLLAGHRAALAESGYAFRSAMNASYPGLYDSRSVSRGTVAKEFAPFRIHSDVATRQGNRTVRGETDAWGNESVVLYRYRLANRTVYQKYFAALNATGADAVASASTVNVAYEASQSFLVEFAVRSGEYEVSAVETRDGLTLTTLRATGVNRSFDGGFGNVSRYDSTLVVDERGRVHRLDTTLAADEASVELAFELTTVGGVAVAYPRWADRALATVAAEIDVDADTAGNYFVVSNEAGDTLPPGSQIRAAHAGVNATLELTDPLAPGERVYVYFPADGARPVLAAEPPAAGEAAPLDGEYEFQVADPAGNPLLNVGFGFGTATPANETSVRTVAPTGNGTAAPTGNGTASGATSADPAE